MDSSIIAVRIANGSFVKVLDTSSRTRRRLVLTTVRDGQTSVKIDLFRASADDLSDAEYVSSLTIDDIEPAEHGTPDIALLLGVDDNNNLNATAIDKKSGESQSLSFNLSPGAEAGYEGPDFELSDSELTLDDLSMDEEELTFDEDAATMSLTETVEEVTLEPDDLTIEEFGEESELESEPAPATELEEEPLAGLEEFSDESVGFDASLADESEIGEEEIDFDLAALSEEEGGDEFDLSEELESVEEAELEEAETAAASGDVEAESISEELPELEEGMVEAELGDEDFTFDEMEPGEDENLFGEEDELEAAETTFEPPAGFDEAESTEGAIEFEDSEQTEEAFAFDESAGFEDEAATFESDEALADELEDTLSPEEFARLDSEPVAPQPEYASAEEQPLAPRRSNGIVFVGYIILALAALGVLTYLVFKLLEGPPAPPLRASLPLLVWIGRPGLHRAEGARLSRLHFPGARFWGNRRRLRNEKG